MEPIETPPSVRRRLGEILLDERIITQAQLDEALLKQKDSGQFLGQVLVEMGYVSHHALINFLVKQCRIPHINLLDYQIDEQVLALIPEDVCLRHSLLPIDRLGRILTVAMVDPLDLDALEEIRAIQPELKIKPILCEWNHFEQAAGRLFKLEDDAEHFSMAALGLTSALPATDADGSSPVETPHAHGEPELKPGGEVPPKPSSQATHPQESITPDVAHIVSNSIREAMRESAAAFSLQLQHPPAEATPSWEDMATLMRESVRDAMREAMAKASVSSGPVSSRELVEGMRETLRETMHEAFAMVMESSRKAVPTEEGLSAEELARIMQGSVRDAMREAMTDMTQAAKAAQAAVQVAMESRDAQTNAVLTTVQAAQTASEKARAEAERAANQMETLSVGEHTRRGLMRSGSQQRKRREVAAVLGKTESDALDALEGPSVSLRVDERILAALESEAPLAGYTFDNFIVGQANAFTMKVSRAIGEQPGGAYNPCFLYGEVGVGKTHLINAIGNLALAQDPDRNVGYVSSSRFARRLSDALDAHALDEFREAYAQWDMLILDDIQFLGGRIEAQEEFFHIFNVLEQEKRQIVIAGDKPPDRLGQLEQRLISRFGSGIVTSLQPPDWETRLAILHHYVQEAHADVSEAILALIATRVTHDIRRMTGSLRKVVAYAELTGQPVTDELVGEILGHLGFGSAE